MSELLTHTKLRKAYLISEEIPHDTTGKIYAVHFKIITEICSNESTFHESQFAIFTEYLKEEEIEQIKNTKENSLYIRLEQQRPLVSFCLENKIPFFSIHDRGWYGNNKIRSERYISYFLEKYYSFPEELQEKISPIILVGMPHKEDFQNFLKEFGFQVFYKDIFKEKLSELSPSF